MEKAKDSTNNDKDSFDKLSSKRSEEEGLHVQKSDDIHVEIETRKGSDDLLMKLPDSFSISGNVEQDDNNSIQIDHSAIKRRINAKRTIVGKNCK